MTDETEVDETGVDELGINQWDSRTIPKINHFCTDKYNKLKQLLKMEIETKQNQN